MARELGLNPRALIKSIPSTPHFNLDRDNAPAYDENKNDREYLLTTG
jgi:hypothetical protein